MESAILGLMLDSSVLITAERRNLRPDQAIQTAQEVAGEIPVVLVAEIGHGIFVQITWSSRRSRESIGSRYSFRIASRAAVDWPEDALGDSSISALRTFPEWVSAGCRRRLRLFGRDHFVRWIFPGLRQTRPIRPQV